MNFIQSIPYSTMILASLLFGLAPYVPEPHLIEKIRFLMKGELTKPIDIFDLLMHASPLILLSIKFISEKITKKGEN
jgi:hypothetical protein